MVLKEEGGETVTGTISWTREASYTVTEYENGVLTADTDDVEDTRTADVTATYADSVLRFVSISDSTVDTLLEGAEIVFDGGVGRVQLVHRYLSKPYVGAGGEQETHDFIVPLGLTFRRAR